MFWLLDKAILKRHGSLLAPVFSCPATIQMNTKRLCLLLTASLSGFATQPCCSADMTLPCPVPGESPSRHIRLTSNLIITDSVSRNEVHVMSFCPSGGHNSATCLCERLPLFCKWAGGRACWGFFTRSGANRRYWFSSSAGANSVQACQACPQMKGASSFMLCEWGKQNCRSSWPPKAKEPADCVQSLETDAQ